MSNIVKPSAYKLNSVNNDVVFFEDEPFNFNRFALSFYLYIDDFDDVSNGDILLTFGNQSTGGTQENIRFIEIVKSSTPYFGLRLNLGQPGAWGYSYITLSQSTVNMREGVWYHVVINVELRGLVSPNLASDCDFYVNGTSYSYSTVGGTSSLAETKGNSYIGDGYWGDGSQISDGYSQYITEVMLNSKLLSSAEVTELYNRGRAVDYDSLSFSDYIISVWPLRDRQVFRSNADLVVRDKMGRYNGKLLRDSKTIDSGQTEVYPHSADYSSEDLAEIHDNPNNKYVGLNIPRNDDQNSWVRKATKSDITNIPYVQHDYLYFNGTSAYGVAAHNAALNLITNMSVCLSVFLMDNTYTNHASFIQKDDGSGTFPWEVGVSSTGYLYFRYTHNSGSVNLHTSTIYLEEQKWYNIVVTRTVVGGSATVNFYVNEESDLLDTLSIGTIDTNTEDIAFAIETNWSIFSNTYLKKVAIYNSILSTNSIQGYLHNATISSGYITKYLFDEQSGNYGWDMGSNNLYVSLANHSWTTTP